MKVIEKLFNTYNNVSPERFLEKYLAAVSILELTDGPEGPRMKRVREMRDKVSKKFPVSIYTATYFLNQPFTKYGIAKADGTRILFDKSRGHDFEIRERLARLLEDVNAEVVKSLEAYNTDRGRIAETDDATDLEQYLTDEDSK